MAMSADMKPSNRANIKRTFCDSGWLAGLYRRCSGFTIGRPIRSVNIRLGFAAFRPWHIRQAGQHSTRDDWRSSMRKSAVAKRLVLGAVSAMTLALAACGSDPLTRGVSGGLLGAG